MYFSPRKTTLKFSEEWGKSHRGMGKELRELKCAMGKELSIEGVPGEDSLYTLKQGY